ncbi:hypothetical protein Slin15195_G079250 [Septoria linicola]|uniref:Zn(2)-C6 fungal-type domain-containing protein n=1 Tax=Septoria linicola TaxID=215465 RepID=A0A9Q9AZJ0_9PEZI|nr:hypothetical protein Slin14017_G040450 [Septoria linicola]USW54606.1 hypothetical protein Slin15195_G079250 [Septoria linicola]
MTTTNGEAATPNGDSNNGQSQKRQRAKQACEPCRLRKRRCDGNMPCNMCTQFEYKCYFEKHPRKRSKLVEQHAIADAQITADDAEHPENEPPSIEDMSKMRALEANSGIAFTRLLGMRLDPSSGPKLFTFGWNLGSSQYLPPVLASITDFLNQHQMEQLAKLYFANVHPIYGFLNKGRVTATIAARWATTADSSVPDHMLCGIAALGILYSDNNPLVNILPRLIDAQKTALESSSTMLPPTLVDVQSWILRCLVLRTTDHPHATWMATCTTMHLVESIGLQLEASSSVLHPAANDSTDPELRRRSFWVARMLNAWVSFEYGRTRVALRGITARLPSVADGDYTKDYIELYSISCYLDPEQGDKAGQWEDFLTQLDSYEPKHDGIALSKANLGLCGYRRLRLANPNLSPDVIKTILNIGLNGLEAARRMAEKGMPWWHVANVPFQVICVFLAMDGKESLSHLATAMRTLEYVVERFRTVAMKEALKTARFLIRLSKKRKDEDSQVLGMSIQRATSEDPQPEDTRAAHNQQFQINGAVAQPMEENHPTAASSEDWNLDALNDSQFDWNYFLTHDMPAFNTFAPDGTM